MSEPLSFIQIVVAVVLLLLILSQSKGSAFTGQFNADQGGTYRTRRGLELFLFRLTIGMGIAFVLISLVAVIVDRTA